MSGNIFPIGMIISTTRMPVTVTSASGTPIVVGVGANHGFVSDEYVDINGVAGNLAANGSWHVSAVSSNTITLSGSTTSAPYTSGGIVTPAGWIACLGQIHAWGLYTGLRNVIGTTFGGTNGVQYTIPSTLDRSSVGLDTGQVRVSTTYNAQAAATMGAIGGESTHLLTVPEIPDHTHSGAQLMGEIGYAGTFGLNNNGDAFPGYAKVQGLTTICTGSTGIAGLSVAHDNLPPYHAFPDLIFGGLR